MNYEMTYLFDKSLEKIFEIMKYKHDFRVLFSIFRKKFLTNYRVNKENVMRIFENFDNLKLN